MNTLPPIKPLVNPSKTRMFSYPGPRAPRRPKNISGAAPVRVCQQGAVCEVKRLGLPQRGGGKRGKASIFGSRQSAGRYRRKVKRIDFERVANDYFVPMITLTWGGALSFIPQAAEKWTQALDKFERRFRRKFRRVGVIWAWENQDERTSKMPGSWFPHTHLICFFEHRKWHMRHNFEMLCDWVRQSWAACIWEYLSSADRERVRDSCGLTNVSRKIGGDVRKQLLYLVSYIGKEKRAGRGFPGDVGTQGGPQPTSVFNTDTYQAAENPVGGRSWGIWNEQSIPWAEKFECVMAFGRWFYGLRRASTRFYPGLMQSKALKFNPGHPVGGDGPPGYTLESCSDLRWFLYALQLGNGCAF